jgi:nitrite reductase/ring-hydroxylating ferredoxin subunit
MNHENVATSKIGPGWYIVGMQQAPLPFPEWLDIGASDQLPEGGALRFELRREAPRRPLPCFVVRKKQRLLGFLNRCMHWPVTLDMETNDFWDYEEHYLQCRTHGALYDLDGYCIAGPCTGERLIVLPVLEQAGRIYLDQSRLPAELAYE